ncbi:MAG: hypothetical protein AB1453_02155 [Chloroflexota bacterium]|jgi:hypothetical protein
MRKIIFLIIVMSIILVGCGILLQPMPTPDEATIATQVAAILTAMPTPTGVAQVEPTPPLPTIPPTETPVQPPEVEKPLPTPTATLEPTPTPTLQPSPTPTVQPTPTLAFTPPPNDPANRLGNPSWVDNMDTDRNWPTGEDRFTDIGFSDGVMFLKGLSTADGWRMTWHELTNAYIEMTFQTEDCSTNDRYGMIVRVPESRNPDRGYLLGFTCDGRVSLRRWNASVGAQGEMFSLIPWTANAAIRAGDNQTNRMGLMVIGDRLIVYANGQLVGEVKDDTFPKGYFGVFVGARDTANFTVKVDQVRFWENPTP